jgi:uncharacterized repeat protein (TIGR01451 family)
MFFRVREAWRRSLRILTAIAASTACVIGASARAQVSGILDWSTLGIADEAVIPSGTTSVSAGVTSTVTWSTTTDGGSYVPYAGADFVSYESGAQGGFTGFAQLGFDNERQDPDDKITVRIGFSEAVTNLRFTLTDIDQSAWDDFVEVYYNTGAGWVNAKTGAFETLGTAVARDDETFGDGWEGVANSATASTNGNAAFNFGALRITAIRIVYFSGDDAGGGGFNPSGQQMGISDVTYDKLMPLLTAIKTVALYPGGAGAYAVPGSDVRYTITVTNSGPGAVDSDTLFLADKLPAEAAFYNGDIDGPGPETNPVAFSQTGAGLTFAYATDVRFSNAVAAPANFAACTYAPIGGYDPAVTYICFNPKGAMQAGSPSPTFSLSFRTQIK